MLNFEFKNPTKIIFGKGEIAKISREIPKTEKILVLYGGGSIKTNGVYDQVKAALEGYNWEEFGGIPANPEYEVLLEALKIIKENYNLRTVELTPTYYTLRVTSVNNYVNIDVDSRIYNQNNIVEFFNEIKNPVDTDDLRNYWYSKFERKIQI